LAGRIPRLLHVCWLTDPLALAAYNAVMIAERYYTPNPDALSPVGLLEVSVEDEPPLHNHVLASLIRQAVDYTGLQDPQALIMEAFYRGNDIHRELVSDMEPTVHSTDVAWPLKQALCDQDESEPGSIPFSISLLDCALDSPARQGVSYITPEGLVADPSDIGFTRPLLEQVSTVLGLGDDEIEIANELGMTAYGYEAELIWRVRSDGNKRPILQTSRQHTALGRIAADGSFEHMVTVLSPDHPGRGMRERHEYIAPD